MIHAPKENADIVISNPEELSQDRLVAEPRYDWTIKKTEGAA